MKYCSYLSATEIINKGVLNQNICSLLMQFKIKFPKRSYCDRNFW